MDSVTDPINNLVNFSGFDDNGEDIRVIADRHLFDNGQDIFGVAHSHQAGESMTVPGSGNRVDPSAHVTPEGFDMTQFAADRNFFDHNLELFPDQFVDTGLTDYAPIGQPVSQFAVQQNGGNLGISLEPAQLTMSQMPALAIQPAMMLNQIQASSQIVQAAFEEQQQWQAFKSQQTLFYQPQPQVSQLQQTQASHRWVNTNEVLGLGLQLPFDSPADELFQGFLSSEAPLNPQQTADPSQQDFLSEEQIQRLRNAEPGPYIQPSADFPPTDAALPHSQLDAEPSPQSRSTRGHRSLPSRTPSPEPTRQAVPMGLSFNSLDEAVAAMSSRPIENAWEAPTEDLTIPTTQAERAKYVLDLFEAFQDCTKCKDNKNGNSFVKRWSAGPGSYYNLLAMEKVCWHMLDIAVGLHTEGPQSTNMYCEEALKKLKTSRDMTFQQRIYHICAMLRYSKYLCDHLMKGEDLEALVGAPKLKMAGAITMQVQNTRRQKWIVHGRTEDLHHSNADRNANDDQDHFEEAQVSGRKTKTKQQTKQPATTKPRSKPKAGSANTLRDETDDDEEAAHRRQSVPGILQAGHSPCIEVDHEPQQIIAAALQIPTPAPPSKARHNHRESRIGKASLDERKPENMRKEDAMLAAYRAAMKASNISPEAEPAAQKTQLTPSTTKNVPADKTDATVTTTKISSKTKTKTGTRKSRVDLPEAEADSKRDKSTSKAKRKWTTTELVSDHEQLTPAAKRQRTTKETHSKRNKSTPKAKRQRTTKELLAEWTIRNDGSNEDDLREAGYASESGRLSDTETSDTDENDNHVDEEGENDDDKPEEESKSEDDESKSEDESEPEEESESETSGDQTPSPSPSPIRKRKMEKATGKGDRIDQVYPLVKSSRYATKAERETDKRKRKQASNAELSEPNTKTIPAKSRKRKIPASEVGGNLF